MTGQGSARAARALTELATRLARTGRDLGEQARLPTSDFEGLAGDAFRRHTARSALLAAHAARAVGPLAGALAELGRDLAGAAALRGRVEAAATADAAGRLVERADRIEERAQDRWREALGRFNAALDHPRADTRPAGGSGATEPSRPLAPPAARGAPTRPRSTRRSPTPRLPEGPDGDE